MQPFIFKVCPRSAWLEAQQVGQFLGSADDRRDGYLHFSTIEQIPGTLAKHFVGQSDLVLLTVRTGVLGDALRWEQARNGALYPHLYGPLLVSAVTEVQALTPGAGGVHELPKDLTLC